MSWYRRTRTPRRLESRGATFGQIHQNLPKSKNPEVENLPSHETCLKNQESKSRVDPAKGSHFVRLAKIRPTVVNETHPFAQKLAFWSPGAN